MAIFQTKRMNTNVSQAERLFSVIGGSSLVAFGLTRKNVSGFSLAALGGSLLYRGVTGHCGLYQALGVNTADRIQGGVPYELGIRVDQEITIHKSVEELYSFWRNLENLPRFMDHLESVRVLDERRSHWIAKGPVGFDVSWDAEIVNDIPNDVIGWRSLEGSEVDNGGSVRFESAGDGQSTKVRVSLQYNPPAGQLGAIIARLFGEDPKRTIAEDLRRFKELMETGNISTKSAKRTFPPVSAKQWDRDAVTNASEESFPASDPPSWTPETV